MDRPSCLETSFCYQVPVLDYSLNPTTNNRKVSVLLLKDGDFSYTLPSL